MFLWYPNYWLIDKLTFENYLTYAQRLSVYENDGRKLPPLTSTFDTTHDLITSDMEMCNH